MPVNSPYRDVQLTLALTKAEWTAIKHRLEAPDCIIEALTDGADPAPSPAILEAVIDALAAGDLFYALAINHLLVHEVLVDCIEGSTWAVNPNEPGNAQRLGTIRSAARKVSEYVGRPVYAPDH